MRSSNGRRAIRKAAINHFKWSMWLRNGRRFNQPWSMPSPRGAEHQREHGKAKELGDLNPDPAAKRDPIRLRFRDCALHLSDRAVTLVAEAIDRAGFGRLPLRQGLRAGACRARVGMR